MSIFPELPEPGPNDAWGFELNDGIDIRANYLLNEINEIKSYLGLSSTSDEPIGIGREDIFNTSITGSGGAYGARAQYMTAVTDFWLSGVRVYTGGGGATMDIDIQGMDGKVWASGTIDTSAATAAAPTWFGLNFPEPIYIANKTSFIFGMKPASDTKTWRRTSSTYTGTLWSTIRSGLNGVMWYDGVSFYTEVNAVGLIEYNA